MAPLETKWIEMLSEDKLCVALALELHIFATRVIARKSGRAAHAPKQIF